MLATLLATVLTIVGASGDGRPPKRLPLPMVVLFDAGWSVPNSGIQLGGPRPCDVVPLIIAALEGGVQLLGG